MNKSELIQQLSDSQGIPKSSVKRLYEAMVLLIREELTAEGSAVLPGVCKLSQQHRAARMGRNPATGDVINIAAKEVIKAKAVHPMNQVV